MSGPIWLCEIFGVIMLATTVASVGRLVLARTTKRTANAEIDACHAVMGFVMAGMLIPCLKPLVHGTAGKVWAGVFAVMAAWFALQTIRDLVRGRSGSRFHGHHLPHLVLSASMVYMLLASASTSHAMAGMPGMNDGTGAMAPVPTLALGLGLFAVAYTVISIDNLPFAVSAGSLAAIAGEGEAKESRSLVLAPRLAMAGNTVMALTMGYMLLMMLG